MSAVRNSGFDLVLIESYLRQMQSSALIRTIEQSEKKKKT